MDNFIYVPMNEEYNITEYLKLIIPFLNENFSRLYGLFTNVYNKLVEINNYMLVNNKFIDEILVENKKKENELEWRIQQLEKLLNKV